MMSVRRSAATFGAATVLGHLAQLLWLVAGIRIMSSADFGTVLAAQALYGVLQIVVDIGTNVVGARMAARGELDDERRGQILRMRLVLVAAVVPVAIVLGALNVSGSIEATLPFVLALGLFALLNVWEPYGLGDARPWATYMFARSGILAAVACGFLIVDATFPLELAGLLECLAIVVVMVLFRRAPLRGLRLALRARGGAWRSVFSVVGPAFATQSSMAAGTLVLSASGNLAEAGVFAASVRLLTGVNGINGIVTTALYPRLAKDSSSGSDRDRRVVTAALGLIALLGAIATASCALLGEPIARAFLGASSNAEVSALVLTMAAALSLGNITMFTYQMLARGHERATVLPFAVGGPATVVFAIAAASIAGARVDIVAGSLLLGQLLTMGGLGLRVCARCPDVAASTGRSMALALLVALLACAALLPGGARPAGLALLALAVLLLASLRSLAQSLLHGLRRRGAEQADRADDAPRKTLDRH